MANTLKQRTAAEYTYFLQNLLPRGLAWSRSPDAVLTKALAASAEELGRLDTLTHLLPLESNPLTTVYSVTDWERVLGLPDECLHAKDATLQERRQAVLDKLRSIGRQDLSYWYELAETLGYDITIQEHTPFLCNYHECGDPRAGWTEESGMTVERWEQAAYPISYLNPPESRYWLNVIVHGDRVIYFRCGGASICPEPLMTWRGAEDLECLMNRDKEAHNLLTFEYRSQ